MQIHVSILVTDNDLIIEQAGNWAPRENHATDLPAGNDQHCLLLSSYESIFQLFMLFNNLSSR
jgi:hypothetical protein